MTRKKAMSHTKMAPTILSLPASLPPRRNLFLLSLPLRVNLLVLKLGKDDAIRSKGF